MTGLRISSEPGADPLAPLPYLPPPAHRGDGFDAAGDDSDFEPVARAVARALTQLFGVPVIATPGRPPRTPDGTPPPRIAASLAAALATQQLGGDLDAPAAIPPGSLTIARQSRALVQLLDTIVERVWPEGCRLPDLDLDIGLGAITGHVRLLAPPATTAVPPPPAPSQALATRLFAMPVRLRVELSAGPVPVRSLLPLRPGTILPIDPQREMPLILGDHSVGRVTLAPTPDGRQQATIIATDLEPLEGLA